jgi:HEAT repeat protein
MLAIINEEYTLDQYRLLCRAENSLKIRTVAISKLGNEGDPDNSGTILQAIQDPHWSIRRAALSAYNWVEHEEDQALLARVAKEDEHSLVKADAIYLLGDLGKDQFKDAIAQGINDVDPYPVVAASILALDLVDPETAGIALKSIENESQSDIVAAISTIYGEAGDTSKLMYFEKHFTSVEGLPSLDFYQSLESLLQLTDAETKMTWMDKFETVATGGNGISPYTKIAATRSMISLLKSAEKKKNLLSEDG